MTAITSLKSYPKDSVGDSLVTNVPITTQNKTVGEVTRYLEEESINLDTVSYIYVLREDHELIGVVSIKEILRWDDSAIVKDIMHKDFVTIHPYTHQEKAAYLALEHNIKAIPIIDRNKKFLGVITSDKILAVMYKELTGNLFKIAGLTHHGSLNDDVMQLSMYKSLKHRVPWVFLGLIGGMLIASVVKSFEATLQHNLVLAGFIPLMVYMSSAVQQQTAAFLIRDFAYKSNINVKNYLLKQIEITVFMAMIMALSLFAFVYIFLQNAQLAIILGASLFGTILSSIITGFFIPYIFMRVKQDPANASGPIGTVIQDFISVVIYLAIATILL